MWDNPYFSILSCYTIKNEMIKCATYCVVVVFGTCSWKSSKIDSLSRSSVRRRIKHVYNTNGFLLTAAVHHNLIRTPVALCLYRVEHWKWYYHAWSIYATSTCSTTNVYFVVRNFSFDGYTIRFPYKRPSGFFYFSSLHSRFFFSQKLLYAPSFVLTR